jgi:hypothetical protein
MWVRILEKRRGAEQPNAGMLHRGVRQKGNCLRPLEEVFITLVSHRLSMLQPLHSLLDRVLQRFVPLLSQGLGETF